jgi:hypothetical protein
MPAVQVALDASLLHTQQQLRSLHATAPAPTSCTEPPGTQLARRVIEAPCAQSLRHGDPIHAQEGLDSPQPPAGMQLAPPSPPVSSLSSDSTDSSGDGSESQDHLDRLSGGAMAWSCVDWAE